MPGYKERLKQRAVAQAAGDKFKFKEGDSSIRVLPTPESEKGAEDDISIPVWMHSNLGPDGKGYRACGKDRYERSEGDCYACDKYIPRLIRDGHADKAKECAARVGNAFHILEATETSDGMIKFHGPFLLIQGGKIGSSMLSILGAGKTDLTHPKKGRNMTIIRTGEGLQTRYAGPMVDDEALPVPDKYIAKLKPFIENPDFPIYDEASMRSACLGGDGTGDSSTSRKPGAPSAGKRGVLDEDEDTGTRTRPKRVVEDEDEEEQKPKAKKKPPVVEPDEDEEEDEDETEQEPEPVKPKPKLLVSKKKPAPVEPDEDEDEDEDAEDEEEEDEPTPPKKPGKQGKLFDETADKPKKKPPVVEPDEDEEETEDEDEEEEDEPAPPPSRKPKPKPVEPEPIKAKKKPAPVVEAEDEPDPFADQPEDDEEEDTPPPPPKKLKKK